MSCTKKSKSKTTTHKILDSARQTNPKKNKEIIQDQKSNSNIFRLPNLKLDKKSHKNQISL